MTDSVFRDSPAASSARSLEQAGLRGQQTQREQVLHVVRQAAARGQRNVSGREVQALFQREFGKWVDMSTLSARINNLIASHHLERLTEARACGVTGRDILPVRALPKQGSVL